MREIVVSGIRTTGQLHLGNYFGAVRDMVKMQESYTCFIFMADYHSLTTHPKPGDLKKSVQTVLTEYLACGLDPNKCTLYAQSDVPETAELYLILNTLAYKGELEKTASFKEKARKQPDNVNAALLTYPVLMAADILLHRAHKVPVGKDQKQHLEMTRQFGHRFNFRYESEFFPLPEAFSFSEKLIKVPGLDGSGKMSKSDNEYNAIFLADDADTIRKKVMKAKSDSGPTTPNQPKAAEIQNLFELMALVSDENTLKHFNEAYNNCNIRYGDMKKQLAEDMEIFIAPIREKIIDFKNNHSFLQKIMKQGADNARHSAAATISEARRLIGLSYY